MKTRKKKTNEALKTHNTKQKKNMTTQKRNEKEKNAQKHTKKTHIRRWRRTTKQTEEDKTEIDTEGE